MTSSWTREDLGRLDDTQAQDAVLPRSHAEPVLEDLYLWDLWPIRHRDGSIPEFGPTQYWMALSASRLLQPAERHDVARIRLLVTDGTDWNDLGPVFPDGATPGSREWAGTAVLDTDRTRLTVRYTAAGYRGEAEPSFAQRIFEATATFDAGRDRIVSGWSDHHEMVGQGTNGYRSTLEQRTGQAGFIKAFRDPSVFRDPRDGREHLLFTASLENSTTDFDAVVGHAVRADAGGPWVLQEPLLEADGVNNEMERPHIVAHAGLYYLFFSTQARTFHPDVSGPTGLYGFVADTIDGSWTPLNQSGLVLRNPIAEPYQAYSWLVHHDLVVSSFVDMHSLGGRHPDEVESTGDMANHFGGTPHPFRTKIDIEADTATVTSAGGA